MYGCHDNTAHTTQPKSVDCDADPHSDYLTPVPDKAKGAAKATCDVKAKGASHVTVGSGSPDVKNLKSERQSAMGAEAESEYSEIPAFAVAE
nr:hypothetical protein BaRGS_007928 [Batillaria attramentaria]